jgi:4-amino-4-deoxy-L-arabinose transferase-like glycosyltransferase
VSDVLAEAAAQRVSGERPGRWRAIVAAVVAGFATALLVYRLLRSRDEPED